MTVEKLSPTEFLHNINEKEDFKKELLLEKDEQKIFFPIYYRDYTDKNGEKIFQILFINSDDFIKNKKSFEKNKDYQLSIDEYSWEFSGIELKPFLRKKTFILCKIIDIRPNFFKIKILHYVDK